MSATTMIENASWVIAWDGAAESHVYLRDADVVFTGADIDFVGTGYGGTADTVIDGAGLMVMPGLVDIRATSPRARACSRRWAARCCTTPR